MVNCTVGIFLYAKFCTLKQLDVKRSHGVAGSVFLEMIAETRLGLNKSAMETLHLATTAPD